MAEPGRPERRGRVKCVVWDLDNTLLSGVWLETGEVPAADPVLLRALSELDGRGVLNSVATRNPAELAELLPRAAAWPVEFVAPQYGWGRKSESLRRVAAELNIGPDALAFVDDDPYERAEVAFALPDVLVLSPEDVPDALGWPELSPPVVTAEARRRAGSYAQARRREQAAREFGRPREEFLRWCQTTVTISPATAADLPRLYELSTRTHQFNSARRSVPEPTLRGWLHSDRHEVAVLRLRDRFGDDGLVGAVIVDAGGTASVDSAGAGHGDPEWTVELLMMSCRAMGRGAIDTLLAWLTRAAAGQGAVTLRVPCRLDERNVPLRLALVAAGFRADRSEPDGDGRTHFARPLSGPLPELPGWASVSRRATPASPGAVTEAEPG
jgi:methoxymalonate biosynthesis protein